MQNKLRVHNSLTRSVELFKPITDGQVLMYVCGPTVYSDVHLGNCRTFVSFDVIYRTLLYLDYKVRYVRNITDVGHLLDDGEDRIALGASRMGLEPMEVVQHYTIGFHKMMDVFNALPPTIEPRATGHIIEQIGMVQSILDKGWAYEANGSVYFDVPKYIEDGGEYGALSGRKVDDLLSETRDLKNQSEKRNPSDFAIWMKANDSHIMRWPSPWGEGFPGWHLECSAMSVKYLGAQFDIHGGGNDLKFPHHENEIAQNNGACDCGGAQYWLHTNMLQMNGKKMSKSDGNYVTPEQLFTGDSEHLTKGYTPMAIRFFMLQAHYRSVMDLTDDALQAAEKGYKRLVTALTSFGKLVGKSDGPGGLDQELYDGVEKVINELCNDFNTPKALARIFELVPTMNALAAGQKDLADVSAECILKVHTDLMKIINDVFGLVFELDDSTSDKMDGVMQMLIKMRQQARVDKNWALSDQIRDELLSQGIELKDGKDGTSWTFN